MCCRFWGDVNICITFSADVIITQLNCFQRRVFPVNEPHSVVQLSWTRSLGHGWSNKQVKTDAHFTRETAPVLKFIKLFRLVNYAQKTFHELKASTNQKDDKERSILEVSLCRSTTLGDECK